MVTAERGPTSALDVFAELSDNIEEIRADVPLGPGERHILERANGGRITCDSHPARPALDARSAPRRAPTRRAPGPTATAW
ncbi:hypothetical protein [Embleya sp. NPDC059259]|uniref:hypothetical protein n=1 Tax=unclassified Embleya TaxID=2699296 RepID=UPI0036CAB2AC